MRLLRCLRSSSGPSMSEAFHIRSRHLPQGLVTFYRRPVYVSHGSMQYLYDMEKKKYLDMFGGIVTVSVGHCHPRVNEALKEQLERLWHTTSIYMHPKVHEYVDRLVQCMPKQSGLKRVFLVNSGSEANDLAMLMARLHTGNHDILSFKNAYHGASPYTMGLTSNSNWRFNVAGLQLGVHHVMNPDPYRGVFGGKHCRDCLVQPQRECQCEPFGTCKASEQYLGQLEEVIDFSLPKGGKMAALFAESIQGVGGTVQFPRGYLKAAFERVRSLGGVCVSDEVQTGFGRLGTHYWGFESHDVLPDIVTLAKGIGNGFPMAAVVTTDAIADTMSRAMYFNTFGGDPLACAVGLAVLEVIEEDECQKNALEVGNHLLSMLGELRHEFEVVGDVRGKGLMIGVELVENKESKVAIDANTFLDVWEECKENGVLVGKGGLRGNVLRFKPPMCITQSDAEQAVDVLRRALRAKAH